MIAPDDPRHGRNAGYYAGCHDDCCREAMLRYTKRLRLDTLNGRPRMIPSHGTWRRIHALMALGWPQSEIARRAGMNQPNLSKQILNANPLIQRRVAERIARVYDEIAMLPPEGRASDIARVRNLAARAGWPPPLAWNNIDDPDEQPSLDENPDLVDPVVIDRILSGDWRNTTATPAERTEVCRRWYAAGGQLAELERRTGWKVDRYFHARDHDAEGSAA